jgi:hypothetical protein
MDRHIKGPLYYFVQGKRLSTKPSINLIKRKTKKKQNILLFEKLLEISFVFFSFAYQLNAFLPRNDSSKRQQMILVNK